MRRHDDDRMALEELQSAPLRKLPQQKSAIR
jgi:hypothetical protein